MATTDRPLRADAKRNYEAIVAAAAEEFARWGSGASLEEIARRAGVGSATLHRRFPSRQDLVQAVFSDQIQALCDRADALATELAPDVALRTWLLELAVYSAETRGLADAIRFDDATPSTSDCEARLTAAATVLLGSAQRAGTARDTLDPVELLVLVNGISLAAGQHRRPGETARAITSLALDGVAP